MNFEQYVLAGSTVRALPFVATYEIAKNAILCYTVFCESVRRFVYIEKAG